MSESVPLKCPECDSKLRTIVRCQATPASKAVMVWGYIVTIVIVGVLGTIEAIMFEVIHLNLIMLIGFVVVGVFFGISRGMKRLTHVKCNKCKWEEKYFVSLSNRE